MTEPWMLERLSTDELRGMVADWLGESLTGTLLPPITEIVLASVWKDRLYVLGVPFEVSKIFGIPIRFSDTLDEHLAAIQHPNNRTTIAQLGGGSRL